MFAFTAAVALGCEGATLGGMMDRLSPSKPAASTPAVTRYGLDAADGALHSKYVVPIPSLAEDAEDAEDAIGGSLALTAAVLFSMPQLARVGAQDQS